MFAGTHPDEGMATASLTLSFPHRLSGFSICLAFVCNPTVHTTSMQTCMCVYIQSYMVPGQKKGISNVPEASLEPPSKQFPQGEATWTAPP